MRKLIRQLLIGAMLIVLSAFVVRAEDNPIFKELTDIGVPLTNGKTIKLPEPVLPDGLDEAQQTAILTKLVSKDHLEFFLRGDINDWFELQKTSETGTKPKDSIGRRVNLYYVAQGKFEIAASDQFTKKLLNQNVGGKQPGKAVFLTDDELKARKLTVVNSDKFKERYAHAYNKILGKVEVSGTGHGIRTLQPESVIVACKLDPQFANDPTYPNQWQPIKIAPGGRAVLGDPEKYSGLGGYIKITKLQGSEDKVFVEYHLIFDEPYGWFNGGPNLMAHLDDVYPKDVKKFRRDLK